MGNKKSNKLNIKKLNSIMVGMEYKPDSTNAENLRRAFDLILNKEQIINNLNKNYDKRKKVV